MSIDWEKIEKYAFEKYGVKHKIYTSIKDVDHWEKQNIKWNKEMNESLNKK
jgi:hypothetical protein